MIILSPTWWWEKPQEYECHINETCTDEVNKMFKKKQNGIPMEKNLLIILFLRWNDEGRRLCYQWLHSTPVGFLFFRSRWCAIVNYGTLAICVFCQWGIGKLLIFKLLGSNEYISIYKHIWIIRIHFCILSRENCQIIWGLFR